MTSRERREVTRQFRYGHNRDCERIISHLFLCLCTPGLTLYCLPFWSSNVVPHAFDLSQRVWGVV